MSAVSDQEMVDWRARYDKNNNQPHYVYRLIDPRTGAPFYIGVSRSPGARLGDHHRNKGSAAFERVTEIVSSGSHVQLEILAKHDTRTQAFDHESHLISLTPGLTNRARPFPCAYAKLSLEAAPAPDLVYVPLDDFEAEGVERNSLRKKSS